MIIDKDREDGKNIALIVSKFLVEGKGNPDNDIPEAIARIRAESAKQAREEARALLKEAMVYINSLYTFGDTGFIYREPSKAEHEAILAKLREAVK